MDDQSIIDICFQKNCCRLKRNFNLNKCTPEIQNYVKSRFDDSESIIETLLRIKRHIIIHPQCPICGNPCKLNRYSKTLFNATCGDSKCIYNYFSKNLESKYGYRNVFQRSDVKQKIKKSLSEHYGVHHPLQSKEIKNSQEQTCIIRYGSKNVYSSDYGKNKIKSTLLKNYGVDNAMKSDFIKQKFNWPAIVEKQNQTKRKNHSFNQSKLEDQAYDLLKEKWLDVCRQFHSEQYPFNCDFYIPSINLYVECNFHWTHGGHPYSASEEDLQKVEQWKSKHTKYYDNAIHVWTVSDVNKRNTAQKNQLNYIEFWNITELKKWICL